MAIDITNYKPYISDFGISDDNLTLIINDIIREIAQKTRMFKTIIGFQILEGVTVYDFGSIFKINLAEEQSLVSLSASDPTLDDILEAINDGTGVEIKVDATYDTTTDNSQLIDVTDVVDTNKQSIFNLFEPVNDLIFEYIGEFNDEPMDAYAIGSIIPDVNLIYENIEEIIKPTIIAGLRYYLSSNYASQNGLDVAITNKKLYDEEISSLMNKYPYYNSKLIKRAWL